MGIKKAIFDRMRQAGFEPQELKVTAVLAEISMSFGSPDFAVKGCQI
jgi:hypothetical protein